MFQRAPKYQFELYILFFNISQAKMLLLTPLHLSDSFSYQFLDYYNYSYISCPVKTL